MGKYRIQKRIGSGGFAHVYQAKDTVEGVVVALKIPHVRVSAIDEVLKEVRLTANLEHPNILPIKNASLIDRQVVIAYPLGKESLQQRLRRRMSVKTAILFAEQMLSAVSYAHQRRIIHCDIKPDNIMIFDGHTIRLGDFGIAKVALRTRTILGSGSGTVGYIAPEQALGKLSFRSDVFSLGLVLWRMFAGALPEWPFDHPLPGYERLRRRVHPDFISLLHRALEIDDRRRFADATEMLKAFSRIKPRIQRTSQRKKRLPQTIPPRGRWQTMRRKEFQRRYRRVLGTRFECSRCSGPISETMQHCPWCGVRQEVFRGDTDFPRACTRCGRGMKADWRFCAWCYGAGYDADQSRQYPDRRYTARCGACRGELMPWMKYCPWCRRRVQKSWKIPDIETRCKGCGWGILADYWTHCAWCGRRVERS